MTALLDGQPVTVEASAHGHVLVTLASGDEAIVPDGSLTWSLG